MVGSAQNKGKYGKVRRGGGRRFTSARDMKDGEQAAERAEQGSDDSEEESSEADSDEDSDGPSQPSMYHSRQAPQGPPKLDADGEIMRDKLGNVILEDLPDSGKGAVEETRAERKALKAKLAAAKKNKGENAGPSKKDGSDEESEPDEALAAADNRAAGKSVKIADLGKAPQELSRREREEKQKKEAKERYQKLHAAGKTDEAKADMARLRKIREQREQAAAVRKAEQDVKDQEAKDALEASGKRRQKA